MFRLLVFISAAIVASGSVSAQTVSTYVGPAGGLWSEPTNWDPIGVPNNGGGNTYHVVIDENSGQDVEVILDIAPVNSTLMDSLARSAEMDWIETSPDMAWVKILWLGPESGRWAVLLKWRKGYVAPPHKHLSAAHTFILSGKLQVRDGVLEAGDYVYEPNGMVHDATTALEDTEYLFICDGPVLFFGENEFSSYLGWEQLQRLRDAHQAKAA